jgi:hypothetical protein
VDENRTWWGPAAALAAVGWGAQQFAPLLLMYRSELGVSATTVQAVFATYVVGLVPGLLFGGPVSDRYGRRPVVLAALTASVAASVLLLAGGGGVGWLFAGRLVAGFASGAGFSAGAAWVRELSAGVDSGRGPRRVTVAMTAGFGLGPLVAGVLAQWAPAQTVLPYLPHLALTIAALPLARRAPETASPDAAGGRLRLPVVPSRRFFTVVAPLAPWVFGAVAVAVAYLPGLVEPRLGGHALIFSTLVTLLCAAAGIAVVPLARRLAGTGRLLATALAIVAAGLVVGAAAAAATEPLLVLAAAVVLGAGYGCCQVCGLAEVQRLADPGHLAGLTAAYQAISYLGFAASVSLAVVDGTVPPSALLLGLAALAALTLVTTTRATATSERTAA